jgi:hypothetical protein
MHLREDEHLRLTAHYGHMSTAFPERRARRCVEDHYKAFQFPIADEPVVHVVEGFDLQSWLIGEAAQR